MPCGRSAVGSGRSTTRLSSVGPTNSLSCRLAPSTTSPSGTPCPSVSTLRLTPDLPRSVGLRPVFPPAQGRLGQRPIHRQPVPLDPAQLRKLLDSGLPQFEEDARFHPGLKPIMRRRMRAQLSLVERLPLATGPQDEEDGVCASAISDAWPPTPKAMGDDRHRQQRLEDRPQLIRDAQARRGTAIGRALSVSQVVVLFAHTR